MKEKMIASERRLRQFLVQNVHEKKTKFSYMDTRDFQNNEILNYAVMQQNSSSPTKLVECDEAESSSLVIIVG